MSKDSKIVVAFFKNNMVGSGSGEVIDAIIIEIAKQLKSGEIILVDMGSQDKTYGHLLEDSNWLNKQGQFSRVYKAEEYKKLELAEKVELDFTSGFKHFELYPKTEKKTKPLSVDTTEDVPVLEHRRWDKTPDNLFLGEKEDGSETF